MFTVRGDASQGDLRGFAHADNAGNVFRAGAPIALLVAADHKRRESDAAAHVQRADALGRMKFMAGYRQQIDRQLFDVNRNLTRRLNCVDMKRNAFGHGPCAPICSMGKITPVSLFAHMIETTAVSSVNAARSSSKIERAVLIDAEPSDPIAFFFKMLAQAQHRGMLDFGRDDMAFVRPRFEHAADRRVVALGAATGKDHFHRIGRADKSRHLRARLGDLLADMRCRSGEYSTDCRKTRCRNGSIAAATSGNTRVVALLSK